MRLNLTKIMLFFLLLTGVALTANATQMALIEPDQQTVLKAADPGLAQKRLMTRKLEPKVKTAQIVDSSTAKPEPTGPVNGAAAIQFMLKQVIIDGATVYTQDQLAKIYGKYLNREITLQDLRTIVAALTNRYRCDDYFLSRAILPPQKIHDGVVKIQIIEGYISKINVSGASKKVTRLLLSYAGHAPLMQRPVQYKNLESYALLINDIPGITVNSVLKPSSDTIASTELNLLVEEKRVGGYLTLDNLGTRYLGPLQQGIGVSANSLLTAGDATAARMLVTLPVSAHELRFYDISHSIALGNNGARLTIGDSHTKSIPGFTLREADIRGESTDLYAQTTIPIIRSRTKNLAVFAALDYLDSTTTLLGDLYYHDKLRTISLGTSFDSVDSWRGINALSLTIEKGLKILDSSPITCEHLSRADGRPDFVKLNAYLARVQTTKTPLSAFIALQGQYAFSSLLANEEFTFGGSTFGRGYDPSTIIGDKGVAGTLELRYNRPTNLPFLRSLQYYTFYDAGLAWNYGIYQPVRESATSAGLGFRIDINQYVNGKAYVAKPLTMPAAAEVAANTDGNGLRFFFQITASY